MRLLAKVLAFLSILLPAVVSAQLYDRVIIEGLGEFEAQQKDRTLILARPTRPVSQVSLAINPVYIDGKPSIEIPGVWDTEIRHLRAVSAPGERAPLEVWDLFLRQMRRQTRELATLPTNSKHLHLSTDGIGFDLWPAETHRHHDLLPSGVGFEVFSPLASGDLGGRRDGGFSTVDDLRAFRTWVNRTRGAAGGNRQGEGLRGMSLTFGSFCTRRHDPVALVEFLASLHISAMSLWAIEGWSQRPGDELYPWARIPGPGATRWDLHTLDEEYFERVEATAAAAEDAGITLFIYLFDRSGLRNTPRHGRWPGHPFNGANAPAGVVEDVPAKGYPQGVWATSGPFWDRVVVPMVLRFREVAERHRNVILVLCNEATRDMASDPVGWHLAVAKVISGTSSQK